MKFPAPLALAAALLLPGSPAPAGDRDEEGAPSTSPASRVTKAQQDAIRNGLRWLAAQQDPAGSFPTSDRTGGAGGPAKSADYQTAVTSLALLAFLGAGEGLGHGEYRDTVAKAVDSLLRAQDPSTGYICVGNDSQSKMHGHGFATLALAEAWGTAGSTRSPGGGGAAEAARQDLSARLKSGVQKAVDLIERAQAEVGGWDYVPSSGQKSDHEGSVTVCQVQALQAASNRGFRVSLSGIKKAREYMRRSQVECGGFKYRLSQEEGPERIYTYALAAAGVTSLVGLGDYGRREAVEKGMKFLERKYAVPRYNETHYYFYGSFYAVQAFHWAGGERWERFWTPMRARLLQMQDGAGWWEGSDTQVGLGKVYPTAFVLLMLEVPIEYLSIFAK